MLIIGERVMKRNVGSLDRALRIVAGLGVIGVGYMYESWWGAIGIVPLLTATIGWCPAYVPFGLSSCKVAEK
jgi:hypothetical protein